VSEVYTGIKFKVEYLAKKSPEDTVLKDLQYWAAKFHALSLTPLYQGGSSGNLSVRKKDQSFLITASHTNLGDKLKNKDFVLVEKIDNEKNTAYVQGVREPSSETLLHAVIYESRPEINAVFHGHSAEILRAAEEHKWIQTKQEYPYGSKALLASVMDVLATNNFIILKNHGFLSLGRSPKEAGELSLKYLEKVKKE
jgi:ribulose-5-phosphate 4-epimerase/fuculose-1-phosphate aldolase